MEVHYSRGDYFIKEKIDGQTYLMIFSNWDGTDKTEYFNISLQVISKRKHANAEMDNVVTTGKNPYTTINFAIKAFKILEEHVLKKYPSKKIIIHCQWTDNRRRNIYEHFLTKKGYQFGYVDNKRCLMKVRKPIK